MNTIQRTNFSIEWYCDQKKVFFVSLVVFFVWAIVCVIMQQSEMIGKFGAVMVAASIGGYFARLQDGNNYQTNSQNVQAFLHGLDRTVQSDDQPAAQEVQEKHLAKINADIRTIRNHLVARDLESAKNKEQMKWLAASTSLGTLISEFCKF